MLIYIIAVIIAIGVIALDQISKILAVNSNANVVVIPELLKFKLSYNDGAAFSFLSDADWAQTFFKIITIIILAGIIAFAVYAIITKKTPSKWLVISIALIFGGAVGNLIDRFMMNMVRDFIYLFYNTRIFPAIFNVADMALVVGVIMVCVYLLFLEKDAIFKFKKKEPEISVNETSQTETPINETSQPETPENEKENEEKVNDGN